VIISFSNIVLHHGVNNCF